MKPGTPSVASAIPSAVTPTEGVSLLDRMREVSGEDLVLVPVA